MHPTRLRLTYMLCDLAATLVGWSAYYVYRYHATGYMSYATLRDFLTSPTVGVGLVVSPVLWMVVYALSGYYLRPYFKSHLSELATTLASVGLGGLAFFFVMVIDDVPDLLAGDTSSGLHVPSSFYARSLMALWTCVFVPVMTGRYLLTRHVRRRHPDPTEGALVLSAAESRDPEAVYRYVYGHLSEGRTIYAQPTLRDIEHGAVRTSSLTVRPMIAYGAELPLSPIRQTWKRTADVALALLGLVVLAPVLAVLALVVALDSRGPVFYQQERIGLARRPFRMWKFRTMTPDAEASGPQLTHDDDPRITRVGHTLRKYRLDELPQLWNVLRGDMSLVGPRPERAHFIAELMQRQPSYVRLLQLRPGLTSWGMVKYGYAQSVDQMVERMQYDLMYVDNCTFAMDVKILVYTVRTVITGRGL